MWRWGWAKKRRAHTLCTCCVPGPRCAWCTLRPCGARVGLGVSDEELWGWWAELEFSPRAACPQSPGLHYLPAAHWAQGWGRDYTEGLGPAGLGAPWQEEKLLLTRHERGAADARHMLSTPQASPAQILYQVP